MKLLYIVVIFVMVPVVFADDIVWEEGWTNELSPWGGVQERSETAKVQMPQDAKEEKDPQYNNGNADDSASVDTHGNAANDQKSGEESKREINPNEHPLWYEDPLTLFLIGAIGAVLAGAQVYYAKKADRRERRNTVESILLEQKRERARLAVERWQVEWSHEEEPIVLSCVLLNTGRTEATLADYDLHTDVIAGDPQLPDYEKLPYTDMHGVPVGAGRDVTVRVPLRTKKIIPEVMAHVVNDSRFIPQDISPERKAEVFAAAAALPPSLTIKAIEKLVKEETLMLYFYGCIAYTDIYGAPRKVGFCQRYEPKLGIFMVVNKPGFNFST